MQPNRFKSLLGQSNFFNSKDYEISGSTKNFSKNKRILKQSSKETIVFEDNSNSSLYNFKKTLNNSKEVPVDQSLKSITLIDKREQIYDFSLENAATLKKNVSNRYLADQKTKDKTLNKSLNTMAPEIKNFYLDIKFTRTTLCQSQPKIKKGNVNLVYDLQHKIDEHLKSSLDQQYLSMYTLPYQHNPEDLESDDISEGKAGPEEYSEERKIQENYNFDFERLNEKDHMVSPKNSFILSGSAVEF